MWLLYCLILTCVSKVYLINWQLSVFSLLIEEPFSDFGNIVFTDANKASDFN